MNQSRAMRYVGYSVTAILMIALAVAVLFAACFVSETEKKVAFWSTVAIVAICATPHFRRRLREQCSIFFLLVTAYIILAGASTLYAYAPKFALSEFSRLLAAYAVFLTAFTFAKRETFPHAVAVLSGATSLLSLLHLDAASGALFAQTIMRQFQLWTGGYSVDQYGYSTYGYNAMSNRLYGLFGNSNSMATMCAIGIFLALYLLLRSKGIGRLLPSAALVINAVTFLMCISLGATMSLGATVLLVLLCLHGARNRLSFLLVTLETLVVSAIVVLFCFPRMGPDVPGGEWVLAYCAAGCLALFALDWCLRPRLVNVLCKHIKLICIILLVLILLAIGIFAFSLSQTTSVTIQGTEMYHTRFFPGSGECSITLDLDGEAQIRVQSTTKVEILTGSATTLLDTTYNGTVTIDIPEDAVEIQLRIMPVQNGTVTIHGLSYIGTMASRELPAGYRWLPNEIVQRLQSLSSNHSAMQRIVFMQDGLKMWRQAPIFGRGLGGFENGLASVQSFFYETKYAHNHYVQVLCDLGVVGLILFLSILGFAIRALWPLRRQDEDNQTLFLSMIGAVAVFAIHGGLEISASVAEVTLVMFGTLGIIAHVAPMPAPCKNHTRIIALSASIGIALLSAVYGFFLYQNARAAEIVNQDTVTTSELKQCVKMDVFEADDYRLTYVVAAMSIQDEEVYQQADIYAEQLQNGHSNAVGPYLTEYYLHRGEYEKAAEASEKFLLYTRSNPEGWNTQFHTFESAIMASSDLEQKETIVQIALETYDWLIVANEEQVDDLPLDAQSASFITRLLSTNDSLLYRLNNLICDTRFAPDTNDDGCPDNAKVLSGRVHWGKNGEVTAIEDTVLQFELASNAWQHYTITLETENPELISISVGDYPTNYTVGNGRVEVDLTVPNDIAYETLEVRVSIPANNTVQRLVCVTAE